MRHLIPSASWRLRLLTASVLAAGLVVVGATTGGAIAASAAPSNPDATVIQDTETMIDTVSGAWGSFYEPAAGGGFDVNPATTQLAVTLPAELSGHFPDLWNFEIRTRDGAETLASGALDLSTGSAVVAVPSGALTGRSEVELSLSNTPGGSSAFLSVSLTAILHVRSAGQPGTATIPLLRSTASHFGRNSGFGSSPRGVTAAPGSYLTITSPAGMWTHGPDGDWAAPGPITAMVWASDGGPWVAGSASGTASPDGSSVIVRLPTDTSYFSDGIASREITVQVNMASRPGFGTPDGTTEVQAYLHLVPSAVPAIDRVQGADRFTGAVAVSQQAFPDGARTVFVVTGGDYPDALSAGPAAVHRDAPLLLTRTESLPAAVAAELFRLAPDDVYVVGGPASVSDAVIAQIANASGGSVHRIAGADRYATSRALAAEVFSDSDSGLAYVATGANFPDALAAGGAAGHAGAPVVLVNGGAPTLDPDTAALLRDLGVTRVKIAGGPVPVSAGIERDLAALAPTVRLSGADRVAAATAINLDAYGTAQRAFVVTGYAFPDALSGSAWAGRLGMPLYVSRTDCLPAVVADAIEHQGATRVTLLGGPAALAPAVADYRLCSAG